ncbi:MAG: hypothetical protein V4619_00575 [Bacteroidota bacterium]
MKNLNIEKATTPKTVKSVISKFIYSLCAALFFLTCSLSAMAQPGTAPSSGSGTPSDICVLPTLTTSYPWHQESACTSCSPLTNDHTASPGADKWIEINIGSYGYLSIFGGTSDFDSIFYLFDSSWNPITTADDGQGSGDNVGHSYLQPEITYIWVAPGDKFYLIVDGNNKYTSWPGTSWTSTSGTVNIDYVLQ